MKLIWSAVDWVILTRCRFDWSPIYFPLINSTHRLWQASTTFARLKDSVDGIYTCVCVRVACPCKLPRRPTRRQSALLKPPAPMSITTLWSQFSQSIFFSATNYLTPRTRRVTAAVCCDRNSRSNVQIVSRLGFYVGRTGGTSLNVWPKCMPTVCCRLPSFFCCYVSSRSDVPTSATVNSKLTPNRNKYPYIHGYFVASFSYFNGTSSVYVCIRKSSKYEVQSSHIAMWACTSLFRRFTYTIVYGTGSVKVWKTRHKNNTVDIRISFLQCSAAQKAFHAETEAFQVYKSIYLLTYLLTSAPSAGD